MEVLIADSGGTKTDWCFIDSKGKQTFFSTESYHPTNWNESFWVSLNAFWKSHVQYINANLLFYGAGCLDKSCSEELKKQFLSFGFSMVNVKSDLFAAGKSVLGNEEGVVAILGTGSVLFHYDGFIVDNVIGGKGYKEGDEGSGYYFGKLVFDAFINGELSKEQESIVSNCIDKNKILSSIETSSEKLLIASISFSLSKYQADFIEFHILNIKSFYEAHKNGLQSDELYLVGSYAFYHQVIIKKVLKDFGIIIKGVVKKPIRRLAEQTVSFIE